MIWKFVKWVVYRFDAETIHRVMVRITAFLGTFAPVLLRGISGTSSRPDENRNFRVFGMVFRNRVGLAAGFDKHAELIPVLPLLGFGFVEIGTVTPRPQQGNPRPRLFRAPEKRSFFNRMGFNSDGAEIVAKRLARSRSNLPKDFRIGVNIGKNRETPLEGAAADYAMAVRPFRGLADYLVINVSSPNTPGLRELQSADLLRPIVDAVDAEIRTWEERPPLLLKLAPEFVGPGFAKMAQAASEWGVSGWVISNTLAGHFESQNEKLAGGWSGEILTEASRAALEQALEVSNQPIISVGGIMDSDEACKRVHQGAALVQVYSGWIEKGPRFPEELAARISSSVT